MGFFLFPKLFTNDYSLFTIQWHSKCFIQSGQLGHEIKTPPPPLHRARFATVLLHLPSVPSVVLPITSPAEKAGLISFKSPVYLSLSFFDVCGQFDVFS